MKYAILIVTSLSVFVLGCTDHSEHDHGSHQMNNDSTLPAMEHMHHDQVNHSDMIALTDSEKYLVGIKTQKVNVIPFEMSVSVLGIVSTDENTQTSITAKISGRVETLYARNPGMNITVGAPLFTIYSETILAGEMELLQLTKSGASTQLIEAARNKLLLYGLDQTQIEAIERSKLPNALITIRSSVAGYIETLNIREGQYVNAGVLLFDIATLDFVRVNAQLYSNEIAALNDQSTFRLIEDTAKLVTLIVKSPVMEQGSKIYNVILRVSNKDHLLRPGMMVTVQINAAEQQLLAIPRTALLEEQGMRYVWVQESDGMFSRRMVQTGKENNESVEILTGLITNEVIVIKGTYLLNSEYILRNGANSMGGMAM